jgi:DNA polymerase-3 subunit alpha (Gram-positive type)
LNGIVAARDDILIYLEALGVDKKTAFNIMEKVRKKDKNISDEDAETVRAVGAPEWYIESLRTIQYLFPKGHAVAYVMMSVRIAYYKIHHAMAFYAASYSVKTEDIDYETMCKGAEAAKRELYRINALGKEATAKDKNAQTMIELVLEMYTRGINFLPIDIYKSHPNRFIPTDDGILPPFMTLSGLGGNAAQGIVDARTEGEFITRQEFKRRTRVSKTVMELFVRNGLLDGLPENNQISLF